MFDLITIGDATLDTMIMIDKATVHCDVNHKTCQLCLNFADKIPIEHTSQSIGGNAANVAVGVAKFGFSTAIRTELGDDINGLFIQKTLEEAGVDTSLIKIYPDKETRYSVILMYKSERTILSYHAPRTYTLPQLPVTKWIYYTSMGDTFQAVQKKLIAHLKKHPHIRLAVNPGSHQMNNELKTFKEILPYTSILFLNKEEAEKIVGKKKNPAGLLLALQKLGVREAVLTDGSQGSYASNGAASYAMPTYPVTPIAKTGAGDAFASAYLAARMKEKDIPEAMQWGTANAVGVIQKIGAQTGLLTQADVKKTIIRFHTILPTSLRS